MERNEARESKNEKLSRIRLAYMSGNRRKTRDILRSYFSSTPVLFDAAYRTLDGTCTEGQARQLVVQIDVSRPFPQRVRWWREVKSSGVGCRNVCSLPCTLHAANLIVKDVVEAMMVPGDHLYGIKGRGKDVAIRDIKQAIKEGKDICCLVADIKDCFPSFSVEALYELPLPKYVIKHVLDYRNMRFKHDLRKEDATKLAAIPEAAEAARRNGPGVLIQGSPSSNAILAWFLNELPTCLPNGSRAFVYCDNIVATAKDREACGDVELALTQHLAGARPGPFSLGTLERFNELESFDYLGYELQRRLLNLGEVTIGLSGKNEHRLYVEMERALEQHDLAGDYEPYMVERVLQRRLTGFPAMDNREQFMELQMMHARDELAHNLRMAWVRVSDQILELFETLPDHLKRQVVTDLSDASTQSNPTE